MKYEYKKYFQFLTKFRISPFIKDKKYLLLVTFITLINKLNILCRSDFDKYKAKHPSVIKPVFKCPGLLLYKVFDL